MRPIGLESLDLVHASLPTGTRSPLAAGNRTVEEVAKEFETLLVGQMIGAMRSAVPSSELLEASPERRLMDGAFDHEMARSLVDKGGFGVAESLLGALERTGRGSPSSATAGVTTPVAGRVSSGFGPRRDPLSGAHAFHGGVDIAASRGSPIRAAAGGVVTFADWRGSGGQVVEIQHPAGLRTRYAHADRLLVRVGDRVRSGEAVATVGSTGRSTGPHLHFSVERHGRLVDPSPWLDSGMELAQLEEESSLPRL